MTVEEYLKTASIENEWFFKTLSGFEHHLNQTNFPFDLTLEMLQTIQDGGICHYLKLGTKIEHFQRTFWKSWAKKGADEYDIAGHYYGCLGNDLAGGYPYTDMTKSCWVNIWDNIRGSSKDISFIVNICKKYNISILYPTYKHETISAYAQNIKSVYTDYYVLLVDAQNAITVNSRRKKELFELSEAFYKRVADSEIVKEIVDTMRSTPCYSADPNIEISYNYKFSIFEDRIEYGAGYGYAIWEFYKNGLKDLPSAESRVGLGYAIAAGLIKGVDKKSDVKTSSMLDIVIKNSAIVEFIIKIVYPKPPEPMKDVSNLKDW